MLYVAGTHNLWDVGTDLTIPVGALKLTDRYQAAAHLAQDAQLVVGHSLGGAIASEIGSDAHIPSISFGSPTSGATLSFRGAYDPISMVASSTTRGVGHAWRGVLSSMSDEDWGSIASMMPHAAPSRSQF